MIATFEDLDDDHRTAAARTGRLGLCIVGELDGRYLLHWDDPSVDLDAFLAFSGTGDARRLEMAKIDPDGDFSSDYEDLDFVRVGGCD